VHQLADAIHKVLFGKTGIATCRILFSVKKKIEQSKGDPKWVSEIFMADYDGANAKQLTYDDTLAVNPSFVPGRSNEHASSFVYVSYKIGQPKLFLASLKPGKSQRVSSIRANQVTPSLSQSGSLIAFACDFTGRSDIFVQSMPKFGDLPTKPRQIFTSKGTANASPTFSPDGARVAFVSDKDGSPKVYVMKIPAPGTKLEDIKVQLISKRNRENSAPSWSPDGKKLAYCSRTFGPRQIWIYDFETGLERELTQGNASKENPTWAPDSLHLLFNAKDASGTDIYLVNLNQPDAVKITSGPDVKLFPSWEPKMIQ
jgi:TolB protein